MSLFGVCVSVISCNWLHKWDESSLHQNYLLPIMILHKKRNIIREGCKKRPFFIVFYYEGGGVGRKVKRLWSYFLHHVFVGVFQYVPGPPKHVLHLVWSAYVISTALRTKMIAFSISVLFLPLSHFTDMSKGGTPHFALCRYICLTQSVPQYYYGGSFCLHVLYRGETAV